MPLGLTFGATTSIIMSGNGGGGGGGEGVGRDRRRDR